MDWGTSLSSGSAGALVSYLGSRLRPETSRGRIAPAPLPHDRRSAPISPIGLAWRLNREFPPRHFPQIACAPMAAELSPSSRPALESFTSRPDPSWRGICATIIRHHAVLHVQPTRNWKQSSLTDADNDRRGPGPRQGGVKKNLVTRWQSHNFRGCQELLSEGKAVRFLRRGGVSGPPQARVRFTQTQQPHRW